MGEVIGFPQVQPAAPRAKARRKDAEARVDERRRIAAAVECLADACANDDARDALWTAAEWIRLGCPMPEGGPPRVA